MNYKYQVGQEIPVGGIITITGLAHNKNGNPVYNTDRGVVVPELLIERLEMKPLEKVQPEPKQEPVKLYCVEDYKPGTWLTKGKVYEVNANGKVKLDGGVYVPITTKPFIGYFVLIISRPALAGEWIYITKSGDPRANEGSIYEVAPYDLSGGLFVRHPGGNRFSDGAANISPSEYLVLDGYKPEPEKAEPEYLNMKVVCVERGYGASTPILSVTVGKVYTVKDGRMAADNEYQTSKYRTLESLCEGLGYKFTEFKGE